MRGRCPLGCGGKGAQLASGGIGKPEPSEGRAQLNQQSCTFLSLYSTETSLSAESTVLSYTLWNALSQALIYSLTVYPSSASPASAPPLYFSHCPLYLSDRPHPRMLSSSLHTPPALSLPLSLAQWPQKHTSTHTPSFLSFSVVACFAYFLCSLC